MSNNHLSFVPPSASWSGTPSPLAAGWGPRWWTQRIDGFCCVPSVGFARGRRSRAVAPCGIERSPVVRVAALLCPAKGLGDAIVQCHQEPAEVRTTFRCWLSGALCRRWFPLVTRRGPVFASSSVSNTALGGLVRLPAHSPSSRNYRLFSPFSLTVVSGPQCSESAIWAVPPVRAGTRHFWVCLVLDRHSVDSRAVTRARHRQTWTRFAAVSLSACSIKPRRGPEQTRHQQYRNSTPYKCRCKLSVSWLATIYPYSPSQVLLMFLVNFFWL